jgi:hypothetical protein
MGNNFTKIDFLNKVETLGDTCFRYSNATEVILPATLTSCGGSFMDMPKLEKVTIEGGTTPLTIGNHVFVREPLLHTINLPKRCKSIASNTFGESPSLEFVTLEQGFKCSLKISQSTKYSAETLVAIIEAYADLTGQTAATLTIGPKNLEKLTDEQKAIAINKNITLA